MESGHDQHGHCRNQDVYLHPCFGPVCQNSNAGYHDSITEHPDLYADRAVVSEQYRTVIACNLNRRNHRSVESGHHQYSYSGEHDLHVHPCLGTVWYDHYDGYHHIITAHPGLYADRAAVSEQSCTCFIVNLDQRNYGSVVAGHHQHSYGWDRHL